MFPASAGMNQTIFYRKKPRPYTLFVRATKVVDGGSRSSKHGHGQSTESNARGLGGFGGFENLIFKLESIDGKEIMKWLT